MENHVDEIDDVYTKQRPKYVDVDINGIIMLKNRREEEEREYELKKKEEEEKWRRFKEKELNKKEKFDEMNRKKYLIENLNIIRILVIGEYQAGKSSIISRYCYNKFTDDYSTTEQIAIVRPEAREVGEEIYHIEFVDTPPLEEDSDFEEEFFKAKIIIFVYDVSIKGSLNRLKEAIMRCNFYEGQLWGIVANKWDLAPEYKKYRRHELKQYCESLGVTYCLISVKRGKKNLRKFIENLISLALPGNKEKKGDERKEFIDTKEEGEKKEDEESESAKSEEEKVDDSESSN